MGDAVNTIRYAALAAAFAGCAAPALAAAPQWTEAPTWQDAASAYPARARAAHAAGAATLTCTATPSGRMRYCGVLAESPEGYGFGNAARHLAERLSAAPSTAPDGREQQVTIAFRPEMGGSAPYVAPDPLWLSLPSAAQFQAAFPKTENGVNHVRVVLLCDVAAGGKLSGCTVESDEPAGQGYGTAALALAPDIRVGLVSASGVPLVGAKVRVPIRYEMTPAPAAKP